MRYDRLPVVINRTLLHNQVHFVGGGVIRGCARIVMERFKVYIVEADYGELTTRLQLRELAPTR